MRSQTFGEVSVQEMVSRIKDFIKESPQDVYAISIGTDSQNFDLTKIVIVVAVHRKGKGGIFFYDVKKVRLITNIKQKVYMETALSLELAAQCSQYFAEMNIQQDIDIHVDIGPNRKGKTYDLIQEISSWVRASGYNACIKPYSSTASTIANRISK